MICIKVHVDTVAGLKGFVTFSASVNEAWNVGLCMSPCDGVVFADPVARNTTPLVLPFLNQKQGFLF